MKKVLIITYYWPPSGGAGVQRWLKFVKYLREFGWEPVIYTPSNGEIPVVDNSLLKDIPSGIKIIKRPIWEPYSLYKLFIGQKKTEKINTGFLTESKKPKLTEKISVWLRGNLFIPDARKFWIKPSINFLSGYLRSNKIDAIISSGPPHSMHLIANGLKRKINIPWVADFRDPWTNIDFYPELMLTNWADQKHRKLEKQILKEADAVLSIGTTMSEEFIEILGGERAKFHVITNGYDTDDVSDVKVNMDAKFSIAHIGTLVKSRNPEVLWKALSELVKANPDFATDLELKLVGKIDVNVSQAIDSYGLRPFVRLIEYMPHQDVVKEQQSSQILLLIVNNTKNAKGILTGKFFEYLSAKRPILCIGPDDGEVADIIKETKSGEIIGYEDVPKMKNILLHFFDQYKEASLQISSSGIEKYSRRELTKSLASLLNGLLK